jgi:hypothetical protein
MVNDVAIKNYDVRKDEWLVLDKDIREDDNTEPIFPSKDPHFTDKIVTKTVLK